MIEKLAFKPIKKASNESNENLATTKRDLLRIRSANQCIEEAKNRPIPKMLFNEFWHEGELCILFADTNVGKSILAVQIANSISKGEAIKGFELASQKQKVLYFDFEMSDKQFEKRYSINYDNHYQFDDNFLRIELNPNCTDFEDFEKELFASIEQALIKELSTILIIDNLTYLKTQATETAKEALPLMKRLKELKIKYNLSILALAHTPKRDMAKPITHNDLAGSKHLANFVDSIFAIGVSSNDKSVRYIKQIKSRATELIYDSENVILCYIEQPFNFLQFHLFNYGDEREHLKQHSQGKNEDLNQAILDLKSQEPLISDREIAKRLDTNHVRVGRVLNRSKMEQV